ELHPGRFCESLLAAGSDRDGAIFRARRNCAHCSRGISKHKDWPRWSMKHGVVLLSGGLDSATTLAIARSQDYETYALSFDYGQRHRQELEAARKIAKSLGSKEHRIVKIDNQIFGGSALTNDAHVPKSRSEEEIGTGIPATYVPARNTVFLAHALAWAET